MEQTINAGDFVRLTDPLSNGKIVRIENIDEYGTASWIGGSQNCDIEQIPIVKNGSPIGNDIDGYYFTLSEIVQEVEKRVNEKKWLKLEKPLKLYPESALEYWKRRVEKVEEDIVRQKDYIKKVCKESSADILRLNDENKKLKERIKRLEADLEEGGFNDLKKDILTLVSLIPCNEGNESIINDIKNLLKR